MGDLRLINRFAARQHGVFSATQARRAGYDKHAVTRRLASGEWRQFDYRVFGLASAPATWERQLSIAVLSRPSAIVGGASAAFLHGFPGFNKNKPVIVVPGSSNARSSIARVVRAEHFDQLEVVRVRGFETTSVAETLLGLAPDIAGRRLESLIDDLLLSDRARLDDLVAVADREGGRRRRGIVAFRSIVDDRSPAAESKQSSYLERLLERILEDAEGLPRWVREHPFSIGGHQCRVDVFVPVWNLVIEADGRNWHARVGDFESDRRRDNELAARGIQVVRFTFRMLKNDPGGCLATIRSVGRVRSA
ncbi:MAG: type IV toxin-antitoxin system AbiEi family antitoxin domain-containing protein [Acidimicrobiia bacterium]